MAVPEQRSPTCSRCSKELKGSVSFFFRPPGSVEGVASGLLPAGSVKCLVCGLLHKPMLKRSAFAGVIVGTILTGLNQGDLLLAGQWNDALLWKIPLTYCVPFLVATYGALTNSRR